jgi:glycosyltransferase involved in cell wall biosynthesis
LTTTIKALAGINCKLIVVKKMSKNDCLLAQSLNVNYSNIYDLSDNEIINEYIKADIVVFPSLFEGFGMPIIEAQSVGRVVITSNISPMNSVAGNGALLLNNPLDVQEYRSAIIKIINDNELRNQLIRNGLENAKKYRIKEIIQRFLYLYSSMK